MTVSELEDDLSALDVRLTEDVLDRLDEIVAPGEHVGATEDLPPTLLAQYRRRSQREHEPYGSP